MQNTQASFATAYHQLLSSSASELDFNIPPRSCLLSHSFLPALVQRNHEPAVKQQAADQV